MLAAMAVEVEFSCQAHQKQMFCYDPVLLWFETKQCHDPNLILLCLSLTKFPRCFPKLSHVFFSSKPNQSNTDRVHRIRTHEVHTFSGKTYRVSQ